MPRKSKFVQTAEKIIRENPEVFDALLECEHTKKLPKMSKTAAIEHGACF